MRSMSMALLLCGTLAAISTHMSSNIVELRVSLATYLQILNNGMPLKNGSNVTIKLPVLEIFDSHGYPLYYGDSSRVTIPDLRHLHRRLSTLKPITGHESLDTFLKYLSDSGVKSQKPIIKHETYTFLFIRSDRSHSEPEISEEKEILQFLRGESGEKIGVLKLMVSGIN